VSIPKVKKVSASKHPRKQSKSASCCSAPCAFATDLDKRTWCDVRAPPGLSPTIRCAISTNSYRKTLELVSILDGNALLGINGRLDFIKRLCHR
jgi:hypothetical protein